MRKNEQYRTTISVERTKNAFVCTHPALNDPDLDFLTQMQMFHFSLWGSLKDKIYKRREEIYSNH
ncbi:hypothetical protein COY26_00745 [Candidatus Woesearchaeota archaeon CG_4_10_14_0_2_um_filter_33_10]|nr:MAG: hypothetical protein COY26_00745 [Candidatus Woesearchaeota archaeon CG_4_10_14_0_2_um_filter_33_10]